MLKDQHKLNENLCYCRNLFVTNLKWHLIFQKSIHEAYNYKYLLQNMVY